jgi:D-glycero-D-manno-heptose 1,7-bisphosphate phosphatase
MDFSAIDRSWTLFLDRDGVINQEKDNDYVRSRDEFIFYDDALEALAMLKEIFGLIVIVTNQKGVGRELMTLDDLMDIHDSMTNQIHTFGGRIDKIYYCTDIDNDSPNRKPQAGMAHQAKKDFPQIDFDKSIIAGNKLSDMQFGRNAGMATVFIANTHPETTFPHPLIDARFSNLLSFASVLAH